MSDITVSKKDEVYFKVSCEPSIAQEIYNHFSFDVPGAKFHPMFRNKIWDGKLHLYSLFTKELYVGLKPYLEHFAEVNNYTISDETYVESSDFVSLDVLKQFLDSLQLSSKGKLIEIREYQVEAIHKAICDGRKLLLFSIS